MAQHRPRKPAPVEYSTDEEDIIVYDVEENKFESNPDYALHPKPNLTKDCKTITKLGPFKSPGPPYDAGHWSDVRVIFRHGPTGRVSFLIQP
ncbi:hypothetical protein TNCV_4429201 [Trichonephila clavipes]|nr:hypothetical protein TNCV_4429201 [Trichonephila clavipes]